MRAFFVKFMMANPGNCRRFNTYWSAPPVSALARSGDPGNMFQSPVSHNLNIERRFLPKKKTPGSVVEMKLRSNSFANHNYADEITWITCKTRQNLEIWPFLKSDQSGRWKRTKTWYQFSFHICTLLFGCLNPDLYRRG